MVLCYSASNETDISNVRLSSSLLCLALEALAAATMSASYSSTCSSGGNNQICAKSPPVPLPVGFITPPPACAPQPIAHHNPLPLVWCHCCKSRRVIHRVSTTILNPGRVFYKCPNHGVIICLSVVPLLSVADFFNSLVDDLPI